MRPVRAVRGALPHGAPIPRETPEECGGICIKCQACVKGCPTGAKYFADAAFCSHRAMLEQTYAKRRENEFFPPL